MTESKKIFVLDLFFLKVFEIDDFNLFRITITILTKIDMVCHKILLSKSLTNLYKQYLKRFKKITYYDRSHKSYLSFLNNFLRNSEKIENVNEVDVKVEASEDDLPIIKTACARPYSIIITADVKNFKENKEIQRILRERNVKVWNLDEAIENI